MLVLVRLPGTVPGMESCRAAEHALVAALVTGRADPRELTGRLLPDDFTDPAARVIYEVVLEASSAGRGEPMPGLDLPDLLRSRAALRADGYPVREMLDWLPTARGAAHPQAWASLVVASSLARLVGQAGERLVQVGESCTLGDPMAEAGRVLAFAATQRSAIHSAGRRWESLPTTWRQSIPLVPDVTGADSRAPQSTASPGSRSGEVVLERELLSCLVATPVLLDRMPWLQSDDFADQTSGDLYAAIRDLHRSGAAVDLITLTAALEPVDALQPVEPGAACTSGVGRLVRACEQLDPQSAFPACAGYLAGRLISAAVIDHGVHAGHTLETLAAAPAGTGGAGAPLFDRALETLQQVHERGARWQEAHHSLRTSRRPRGAERTSAHQLTPNRPIPVASPREVTRPGAGR